MIEDGANGWLCDINDLGSLIAGIERVAAVVQTMLPLESVVTFTALTKC